jgi:hypothetical protein
MKKIFSIGLGVSLLLSAVLLPLSSASRNSFHAYLVNSINRDVSNKADRPFRPFSNPVGRVSTNSEIKGKKLVNGIIYRYMGSKRNWDTARSSIPQPSHGYNDSQTKSVYRPFTGSTKRILKATGNTKSLLTLPKSVGNYELPELKVFTADNFSVVIPKDATISMEETKSNASIYSGKANESTKNYIITYGNSVAKIARKNSSCESDSGFVFCAKAFSRTLNNALKKRVQFYFTSKIKQQNSKNNTVLNKDIYTRTLTEGFLTEEKGNKKFQSRYFVEGLDDDLFILEYSVDDSSVGRFIGINKLFFNSFRIVQ